MKHTHMRRRFKAVLILLLAITASAFFESRIEAFAPDFKNFAELKIEDIFGKSLDVSIGTLDGGVMRPFALRDVTILGKHGKTANQALEIKTIVSNYRIWDFIFARLSSKVPYVSIDFSTKHREISGFITLKGTVERASVKGYIRLFDGERIEIKGRIRNGVVRFILRPDAGLVKVEINYAADGVLLINITVNHLKFHGFDVIGQLTVKNIAAENSVEGEIEAKNLILNYKPFPDARASYKISNGVLEISNLDLSKLCRINGKFGLKEPYLIDAAAVTDNVNLGQTLSAFNPRYASFINGTMNSKWEFKGPAAKIKSTVHLDIKKGNISEMTFDSLNAELKGDGPIVRIEDSRITRQSGSFVLAGEMDMTRLGKDSLFENLKIAEGEKAILWDDWDTAKWQDVREFRMSKKVIGGLNVGFKKFINDEKIDESMRNKDEFELEYNLHPKDSLKIRASDINNPFFGLEHKDKF